MPFPPVAHAEKPPKFGLRVGDWTFAQLRQLGDFLDGVVDLEAIEKVVQDDAVGVERGARVEALGLSPGEERLHVLGRDLPGIGLGGDVVLEEFKYVLVRRESFLLQLF